MTDPAAASPLLRTRGLARQYVQAGRAVPALAPLDLDIAAGEFLTLLGPSGCGKTTLLRLLAGLEPPTSGRVERPASPPRLSYVFQEPTLMPWATVEANVRLPFELGARDAQPSAADREARVRDVLRMVGLEAFGGALPRELSGGMRMRVSIARALVTAPQLLLMDEPFGALDDLTRHKLEDDLLALVRQQSLTVVFVTHSVFEAVYLSDRVLVFTPRPGRVAAEVGIDAPRRDAAFRVSTDFAARAARLQAALAAGAGVAA